MKIKNLFKSSYKIFMENSNWKFKEMSKEELEQQLERTKKFIKNEIMYDGELFDYEIYNVLDLLLGTHKQLILIGELDLNEKE